MKKITLILMKAMLMLVFAPNNVLAGKRTFKSSAAAVAHYHYFTDPASLANPILRIS